VLILFVQMPPAPASQHLRMGYGLMVGDPAETTRGFLKLTPANVIERSTGSFSSGPRAW